MITNVLKGNYIINNKIDLSFKLRYHIDQVENLKFQTLKENGYLQATTIEPCQNLIIISITLDFRHNFKLEVCSESNKYVWKNSIDNEDNVLINHWTNNVEETLKLAQQNTVIKINLLFRLSLPRKMITAKNIFYSYENLNVLKGINLEIEKGEFVSIVGASGAGKTTLLNILGTLDKIDDGSLYINQKNISTYNEKEISKFRNQEIGFVFQFHNLLNEFTALENICMPAYLNGTNKQIAEKKGLELLDLLDLSNRSKHKPNELSGEQQERSSKSINKYSIYFISR